MGFLSLGPISNVDFYYFSFRLKKKRKEKSELDFYFSFYISYCLGGAIRYRKIVPVHNAYDSYVEFIITNFRYEKLSYTPTLVCL